MPRVSRALRRSAALLRRAFHEFRDDHCQQMAAAISYHLLFSVFPLAITAVGVIGLLTRSSSARESVASAVLRVVPLSGTGQAQLHDLLTGVSGAGALGLIGLVGVLWSASGVMAAIRTSLNVAWDTDERRPFVRGKLLDLLLVAGAVLVVGLALAVTLLTSLARQGSEHLPSALHGLAPLAGAATAAAAFVLATGLLAAMFLFLYRVVPACPTRVREVWPGALVAAVGFEVLQYGFSVYVAHFAHYNRVYGSLGAVVAFLFFIYLASSVFLFGAEVASEYPRMSAAEAQTPPPDDG